MKKWEYDVWDIEDFQNERKTSPYGLFDIQNKLNDRGKEGFELVGIVNLKNKSYLIFKKEK